MSVTMMMTAAEMQAEGGREKWLELRKQGLGGSDAGVIIGVSSWKNRNKFSLWMEKTGQTLEEDISKEQAERMDWGNRLEPVIADWFEATTGKKLRRCGMIRSNEHPCMFADVDRLVVGENAIVEIKTTSAFNRAEWEDDKVPPSYLAQALHYMAVGDYDKCYFVCLLGGQHAVIRELERDDEEIAALIEVEEDFWNNYVLTKTLPEVDGSVACKQLLDKMNPGGDKEVAQLDGEWEAVCQEVEQLENQKRQLEKFIEEKKNKLRLELGNTEKALCGDYRINYTLTRSERFDPKAFEVDFPDLAKKYKKITQFRSIKVSLTKEAKMRRAKIEEEEQ